MSAVGNNTLADMIMKNCSETHQCVTASANFGITKIVINNQCCNTNLCNTQTELSKFNTGPRILSCDMFTSDMTSAGVYFVTLCIFHSIT